MCGCFYISACNLCLHVYMLLKIMSQVPIIYLGHTQVNIILLQMCVSTHHSSPFQQGELDLVLKGQPM